MRVHYHEVAVGLALLSVLRKRGELTRRRYRVVREGGRWVCLGQVLEISPA